MFVVLKSVEHFFFKSFFLLKSAHFSKEFIFQVLKSAQCGQSSKLPNSPERLGDFFYVPRGWVIFFVQRGLVIFFVPRGWVIFFCPENLGDFFCPKRFGDFFFFLKRLGDFRLS